MNRATLARLNRRHDFTQAERQGYLVTGRWGLSRNDEIAHWWRVRCQELGEPAVAVYRSSSRLSAVEFDLEPTGLSALPPDLARDVEDAFSFFADRGFCTTSPTGLCGFASGVPSGPPAANLASKLLEMGRRGVRRAEDRGLDRRDLERAIEEWAAVWFNSYTCSPVMLRELAARLELLVCREEAKAEVECL